MTPVWRRPKWIVGHVVAATLVIGFVNLGLWQSWRLDGKRERNDLLRSRMGAATQPVEDLVDSTPVQQARYRRVRADGDWDPASTVLVRSRALDGVQGYHVVSVLVLDDGRGVLVNRGFVPLPTGGKEAEVLDHVRPAPAHVSVEGIALKTETRGSIGPRDPATGHLDVVNRIEVARLQQQTDRELLGMFVQQTGPAGDPPPEVLPLPDVSDEGPHLSYMAQWFIFATIGAVGWPILVRRASRDDA